LERLGEESFQVGRYVSGTLASAVPWMTTTGGHAAWCA